MEKGKKNKIIYSILILLIIVCIVIIINLINENETALTPDYAPGAIDTNAIKEPDKSDKMSASSGGGAISLEYSNVISINKKDNQIKMYFKNPSKSLESVVLELIITQKDKDYIISKSDLLPPGYALYNMDLSDSIELPKGGYKGKIRATYYNEKTGVKQIINTEIQVDIEVK